MCFLSELNAGVIKSLKEDLLEASFLNITSANMRDVWLKSNGEISNPFKELHKGFHDLAYPYIENTFSIFTFSTDIESVDKNTEMILSGIDQHKYRSTYFKDQTNDLYCILKEILPIMGYQTFVSNYQKNLFSYLTQLGQEVSPLLTKYFEITRNDDLQIDENLEWTLEKINRKAELIILLEHVKSEEGKKKMLTSTCR